MKTIPAALTKHGEKVTSTYNLEPAVLTTGSVVNGTTILLTERLPKGLVLQPGQRRALAYRVVENGQPIVYASYRSSGRLFGVYVKPWYLKGILKTKARMRNGYITVLAHELSEMLVAPLLDQFTMPDSAGKSWRKEVCDPVLGAYYFENVNGQDCVFPDFVLPTFWDVNGKAPYSYMGTAKAPMVWAKGSYAWFRSALTRLTRVQF